MGMELGSMARGAMLELRIAWGMHELHICVAPHCSYMLYIALQDGDTALIRASFNGHFAVVDFMLFLGLDMEATNKVWGSIHSSLLDVCQISLSKSLFSGDFT